jgi:hypothetical protein
MHSIVLEEVQSVVADLWDRVVLGARVAAEAVGRSGAVAVMAQGCKEVGIVVVVADRLVWVVFGIEAEAVVVALEVDRRLVDDCLVTHEPRWHSILLLPFPPNPRSNVSIMLCFLGCKVMCVSMSDFKS